MKKVFARGVALLLVGVLISIFAPITARATTVAQVESLITIDQEGPLEAIVSKVYTDTTFSDLDYILTISPKDDVTIVMNVQLTIKCDSELYNVDLATLGLAHSPTLRINLDEKFGEKNIKENGVRVTLRSSNGDLHVTKVMKSYLFIMIALFVIFTVGVILCKRVVRKKVLYSQNEWNPNHYHWDY